MPWSGWARAPGTWQPTDSPNPSPRCRCRLSSRWPSASACSPPTIPSTADSDDPSCDDPGATARRGSARAPDQPLGVEQHDALALQPDPTPVPEVGERLVDGLPGRADQLGQLLLGEVVRDPQVPTLLLAELTRQLQQRLGHPAGDVGEDQVGEGVVGPAEPPGQYP